MDCASEAQDIEKAISGLEGIEKIESIYLNNQTNITYDPELIDDKEIIEKLRTVTGFSVSILTDAAQSEPEPNNKDIFRKIVLSIGSFALLLALIIKLFDISEILSNVLSAISLLVVGIPIFKKAFKRIRANPFNTDILMSVAAIGSLLIGSYAEGAAVLLLYTLAELLESYTTDRVRNTTKKLATLLPKRAEVKVGSEITETNVEDLRVGDTIVVKPGWRIPIDGTVSLGSSSIDQASVTGESVPVEKSIGDTVLSGTLNLDSTIEVLVTKAFTDSTTSKIIELVMNAQSNKANIEKFVDRFSRYYTPVMLIAALSMATISPLFFGGQWDEWLYKALIVLVIACPSAFLISTPVTILISLTAAMRSGVLVKGGAYIEELARIKVVMFDKTGTLTVGKPKVVQIETFGNFSESDVLKFAAAVEASSTHPLAVAIEDYAAEQKTLVVPAKIEEVSGKGVFGRVEDRQIIAGKLAYIKEQGVDLSELSGKIQSTTQVVIAIDNMLAGIFHFSDILRPEAAQAISELKKGGISHIAMLSGDNKAVAEKIANELGVTDVYAELLPQDKERVAQEIRQKFGAVAMVGDGINDAPVLASSDVGMAMSTAENDIALEAADVALMGGNLIGVPYILRHGRKTVRKLRTNLALALGLKIVMILGGAIGIVPLWVAVLADDGATIVVIMSALPLLFHRTKDLTNSA